MRNSTTLIVELNFFIFLDVKSHEYPLLERGDIYFLYRPEEGMGRRICSASIFF